MEEYKTILTPADVEFVERRSRFIGHVRPVSSEEEALAFLAEMRSQHWDATHNVYAYRLRESGEQRYSDDGGPQGTAGSPQEIRPHFLLFAAKENGRAAKRSVRS